MNLLIAIIMNWILPVLPYADNALEPIISEKTIQFHHRKHHQTYLTNLQNMVQGTEFENADLVTIMKNAPVPMFNNAAQVWNHTFYFEQFSPTPKVEPEGALKETIEKQFGSFDNFKKEFQAAGVSQFGSGWVWLVKDNDGRLLISKTSNADNPVVQLLHPILTFDVWEHAYYLDYQNRRADHLYELWKIVDWNVIEQRFAQ